MSLQDKIKWDEKFSTKTELLQPRAPSYYVKKYSKQSLGIKALDLASGSGRHALYLAKKGFEVEALDISEVACKRLNFIIKRDDISALHVECCDLDTYHLKENNYDFIVMSNYLDRTLISTIALGLKRGAIVIIETYMYDESNEKKDSDRSNLLEKEELYTFFDDSFNILEYDEFDNESYEIYRMKKQVIVVQKRI